MRTGAAVAFVALLARDLSVLRRRPAEFLVRTIVQPLLFVFVLGYVNPSIGLGSSGPSGAAEVATTLLAGMLAIVVRFFSRRSCARASGCTSARRSSPAASVRCLPSR